MAMTAFCLAGEFAVIFYSFTGEGLTDLLDPSTYVFLLINTAVLVAGFLAAFFLFRPFVHPSLWPPYVLSAGCGAAVIFAWRALYFYIFIRIFRLQFGVTTMQVLHFAVLALISFCVCLPAFCLYRFTVDRSRPAQ
jgi:hypothetical protein